jgi:hypothetical protein
MHEEMEAYQDERSEVWHESDRGEAFQERIDALTEIIENLDNLTT